MGARVPVHRPITAAEAYRLLLGHWQLREEDPLPVTTAFGDVAWVLWVRRVSGSYTAASAGRLQELEPNAVAPDGWPNTYADGRPFSFGDWCERFREQF